MGSRHGVLLSCGTGLGTPARLLLAHGLATRSLRPPWSGVSASLRRTTPVTYVLRRWPGPGPGVQATEQFKGLAVRQPRNQAQKVRPDRHGSPRQPRRSNLTILSETLG
jgi:hypothetical protein